MPKIQSAKKALRQNIKKRAANKKKKEALKNLLKDLKKSCAAKNKTGAEKLLAQCYKALDKSAKLNLIHKNKAARLKSNLAKMCNKI